MYVVEFQEPKSGVIIFTGLQIKECAKFFSCAKNRIKIWNSFKTITKTNNGKPNR